MTWIGASLPRPDGPAKVTGAARYVADLAVEGGLEGVIVGSTIAAGEVTSLDAAQSLAVPGVVEVLTHRNAPRLAPVDHAALGQGRLPLQTSRIAHFGEPIALVLGETRIAAAEGAARLQVAYRPEPPRRSLEAFLAEAVEVPDWAANTSAVGDLARGLALADLVIEGEYRTANRHHAAIEPAVATARWQGDDLELETSTQWVYGVRAAIAAVLGVAIERVRVRADHVGGGFGAKGSTWPHEILACVAARALGRPVRIALGRRQSFTAHGFQPETLQRVRLGARADGTLTAIEHDGVSIGATDDDYVEHASLGTRSMYACPNIATRDRVVRLHVPQPTFMRAPHEGPGMVGLEIAMDELAGRAGIDPVELRLRNHAELDPTSGKPFSSKALRECYRLGAERFGWERRVPAPRAMREGGRLVGWGMASALMATFRFGATATVSLRRDGRLVVETAAHDIGTGIRAILPQIAAEALGVAPERIEVRLGDTSLPEAGGTFGSSTTMGAGSAVQAAAVKLRRKLEELAGEPGLAAHEYGEVLALRRLERVAESASWAPTREQKAWAMNAYGAVFAEVEVDGELPVPRVTRVVGAYSVGRIINPLTARSQVVGGIVWGIGQALLERSPLDPASGRFVNQSLSGYRVPVAADVPSIEVLFSDELDPHASPLGARGVGEIGTIGIGAAIANAVFHATGVRVRELPIRVEALLQSDR
jgi:xanthine dehydrogenase YagR molybdenum-binding subunit